MTNDFDLFISTEKQSPSPAKRKQQSMPDLYWDVLQLVLTFNSDRATDEQIESFWTRRINPARKEVAASCDRIDAAPASMRLELIRAQYKSWLRDTADPRIMRFYLQIDRTGQKLQYGSSSGNQFETAGQILSCFKVGLPATLELRERYTPDLSVAFEEIKKLMSEFAERYAVEEEARQLGEQKMRKLLAHANTLGEQWRQQRAEQRAAAAEIEQKKLATKKAKRQSAKQQTAHASAGLTAKPRPTRNH